MAFDYDNVLTRITAKAKLLEEKYQVVLKSRNDAQAKVNELQDLLLKRDKEIQQLKVQLEHLQLASTFAPTREQVENARAMITGLVRDIDRCIADLSD